MNHPQTRCSAAALTLATLVLTLVATAPPARAEGAPDVSASVVELISRTESGNRHGCGFVIDPGGLIATNLSVLNGSDGLTVRFSNGVSYDQLAVYSLDVNHDLIVLKVPASGLPALELIDSDRVVPGGTVYSTCCGIDPLCSSEPVKIDQIRTLDNLGVRVMTFESSPFSWLIGSPIVTSTGRVAGIANVLLSDQSRIAVMSNDLKGAMVERPEQPIPLEDFIAYVRSLPSDEEAQPADQDPEGDTKAPALTMDGTWRIPNTELGIAFVTTDGKLGGRLMRPDQDGHQERFFMFEPGEGPEYEGTTYLLWGCIYKKSVAHKRHENQCQVEHRAKLVQHGSGYATLEFEAFVDGIPPVDTKEFTHVCETCGSQLPVETKRYEIIRVD